MMKTYLIKHFSYLIVLYVYLFGTPLMASPIILQEAIDKGYLQLETLGEGGHSGECIKVIMKNLLHKDIEVTVPAGQIFEPEESSQQDLIVVKEETFLVQKGKTRPARLFGYCIEAGDGSPRAGSRFRVGKMAVGNLLAFALYLSTNNLHNKGYVQNAIWSISDEDRLENIGDEQMARYIARLLGKPEPQYRIQYEQPDRSHIRTDVPVREQQQAFSMNGMFYFTLDEDRLVTMGIYTKEGKFVHAFYENRKKERGYHKFRFEFKISGLEKGDYLVRMTSGEEVIEELAVSF